MSEVSFDAVSRRIEQYRICLDRDARRGIIVDAARDDVDRALVEIGRLLQVARVELEGAGAFRNGAAGFRDHFVASSAMLALRLFRVMYREPRAERLRHDVRLVRRQADDLIEHLRTRLDTAA